MTNYLNIGLNTAYLNRTPNKTERASAGYKPIACLWHETAGYGSLDYCLQASVQASFNYLIESTGTIWHYVDETTFVAWHGGIGPQGVVNGVPYHGLSHWTINGTIYRGSDLNAAFVGIEIEGPNNGQPIKPQQTEAAVRLMLYLNAKYGIPLETVYHPEHWQVAPTYKSDALGYSADLIRQMAVARLGSVAPAPTGYSVDSRLQKVWDACGGLGREVVGVGWVPGAGYAIGPVRAAPDGNGIIQPCERYYIGLDKNQKPRLPLISEVKGWGI